MLSFLSSSSTRKRKFEQHGQSQACDMVAFKKSAALVPEVPVQAVNFYLVGGQGATKTSAIRRLSRSDNAFEIGHRGRTTARQQEVRITAEPELPEHHLIEVCSLAGDADWRRKIPLSSDLSDVTAQADTHAATLGAQQAFVRITTPAAFVCDAEQDRLEFNLIDTIGARPGVEDAGIAMFRNALANPMAGIVLVMDASADPDTDLVACELKNSGLDACDRCVVIKTKLDTVEPCHLLETLRSIQEHTPLGPGFPPLEAVAITCPNAQNIRTDETEVMKGSGVQLTTEMLQATRSLLGREACLDLLRRQAKMLLHQRIAPRQLKQIFDVFEGKVQDYESLGSLRRTVDAMDSKQVLLDRVLKIIAKLPETVPSIYDQVTDTLTDKWVRVADQDLKSAVHVQSATTQNTYSLFPKLLGSIIAASVACLTLELETASSTSLPNDLPGVCAQLAGALLSKGLATGFEDRLKLQLLPLARDAANLPFTNPAEHIEKLLELVKSTTNGAVLAMSAALQEVLRFLHSDDFINWCDTAEAVFDLDRPAVPQQREALRADLERCIKAMKGVATFCDPAPSELEVMRAEMARVEQMIRR